MMSNYQLELSRLSNEYREKIDRAASLRIQYGTPTREEAECYQRAAELCSRLASLTVGMNHAEWVERESMAGQKLREISQIVLGKKAAAPKADSNGKEAPKDTEAKTKKKHEDVPDEVVESWFKDPPKKGFEAVSGMQDLVELLKDCVRDVSAGRINKFLKMNIVHAFFMYGPPGCGKTYIAKAFAHELMKQGYKYMSLSGGDIHRKLVGESEQYVQRAFREAAKQPTILFIDEIDNVCRNRSLPNLPSHEHATTTSFLTSFNDLLDSDHPVIFIGATNYPDRVDVAMMDRVELIRVGMPDVGARENFFKKNLTGDKEDSLSLTLEPGFTCYDMADMTDNFNYRDLTVRFLPRLKRRIKDEVLLRYNGDDNAAAEALESGEFVFTRALFEEILEGYTPSKKADIIRSLDAWDADLMKMDE